MTRKYTFYLLLFVFCHITVASAQETLTLRTDRDYYFGTEKVWYRIDNLSTVNTTEAGMSKVAYLELIDSKGHAYAQHKCYLDNGYTQSFLSIPTNIATGTYELRAYTRLMRSANHSFYARKYIHVINPYGSKILPDGDELYSMDTVFCYPSTPLLEGVENQLLLKAVDKKGHPKKMNGCIMESATDTVGKFTTDELGYASLTLKPQKGKRYYAAYQKDEQLIYTAFPASQTSGYRLLVTEKEDAYEVEVVGNGAYQNHEMAIKLANHNGYLVSNHLVPLSYKVNIRKTTEHSNGIIAILVNSDQYCLTSRVLKLPEKQSNPNVIVRFDKSNYSPNDHVKVSFTGEFIQSSKWTASVTKACLIDDLQKTSTKEIVPLSMRLLEYTKEPFSIASPTRWLPEIEGELITGTLYSSANGAALPNTQLLLSFIGKHPYMALSNTDEKGRFKFVANRYGREEMVIQPFHPDSTLAFYVDLDDAFDTEGSQLKHNRLTIDQDKMEALNSALISSQVNKVYETFAGRTHSNDSLLMTYPFYTQPDVVTVVDKFIELATMEEVIREIVPYAFLRKKKGEYYIKIVESSDLNHKDADAFIMLDGVPIHSVDRLLELAPTELSKIELFQRNYFFMNEDLGRLICFYTKDGNMGSYRFNNTLFRQARNGYQTPYVYHNPIIKDGTTRLPDFRNTLYFGPLQKSEREMKIEFSVTDEKGMYLLVLEGINPDGSVHKQHVTFEVK